MCYSVRWKSWITQVELLSNWKPVLEISEYFYLEREASLNIKYCSCLYSHVGSFDVVRFICLGCFKTVGTWVDIVFLARRTEGGSPLSELADCWRHGCV